MSKDRLLSDDEQNKEVKHILLKLEMLYASKHRIQESNKPLDTIQHLSEKADSQAEDILNGFINTQKKLYAESVEEELVDFAQDVLSQFGYDGRSGGLSTLEYAESLIKSYGKE